MSGRRRRCDAVRRVAAGGRRSAGCSAPRRRRPGAAAVPAAAAPARPGRSRRVLQPGRAVRAGNGPADHRPHRAQGDARQEGRRRRRVRSAAAAARGDRQAGRVEAARRGHPQEAGGDASCRTRVDDTAIKTAENDLALARLETTKNDVLPRIDAEKNTLSLQAAEAKLPSLRTSVALKRKAAAAELEILEVKRDRAARVGAPRRAQPPMRCSCARPIDGLVVPGRSGRAARWANPRKATKCGRASRCSTSSSPGAMRVKVKVNQVDVHRLQVGMPARVTLDAYPGSSYPARLTQISPIAAPGQFSPKVRTFARHLRHRRRRTPRLAPDLSAAVDVLVRGGRSCRSVAPAKRPARFWGIGAAVALVRRRRLVRAAARRPPPTAASRRRRSSAASSSTCCRCAARSGPAVRCRSPRRTAPAICRSSSSPPSGADGEDRRRRRPLRHLDRGAAARPRSARPLREAEAEIQRAQADGDDQRAGGAHRPDEAPLRRRAGEARRLDERGHLARSKPRRRRSRSARPSSGPAKRRRRSTANEATSRRVDGRARAAPREGARRRAPRRDAARGADAARRRSTASITLGLNWRAGGPFAQREWRAGDRAWAGASIAQVPELGSLYVLAKVDETDRGRLKTGLDADVEVQAARRQAGVRRAITGVQRPRQGRLRLDLAAAAAVRRPARSRHARTRRCGRA